LAFEKQNGIYLLLLLQWRTWCGAMLRRHQIGRLDPPPAFFTERQRTMTKFIYIADPMCSWCYGFGPELTTLLSGLQDVPLEIVVGGLRPYTTEVMTVEQKATILSHWEKVGELTGLRFNDTALADEHFIYDTEPACRAVVAAKILAPAAALDVFHAIQKGFYAEGLDTTKSDVLARIATDALNRAGLDIDTESFLAMWSSEEALSATRTDFTQTQRWGVTGFPTLVLERAGELHLAASGYVPLERLVTQLQALVDQTA
jgi:putative protein-disulfide isomerase